MICRLLHQFEDLFSAHRKDSDCEFSRHPKKIKERKKKLKLHNLSLCNGSMKFFTVSLLGHLHVHNILLVHTRYGPPPREQNPCKSRNMSLLAHHYLRPRCPYRIHNPHFPSTSALHCINLPHLLSSLCQTRFIDVLDIFDWENDSFPQFQRQFIE